MNVLEMDRQRYGTQKMPRFQYLFRRAQMGGALKALYRRLYVRELERRGIELPVATKIGGGLYCGHAYGITVNPEAVLGHNVNIHKGVTIGRENRGVRRGSPVIGDDVWIGINAVVVGKITIGNDVLIAPGSYVNFDVPDHSVVIGNPGRIFSRDHATEGYINNRADV